MIIDIADAKRLINRSTRINTNELELLNLLLPVAEANVQDHLGLVLEQQSVVEFYPTEDIAPQVDGEEIKVTSSGVYVSPGSVSGTVLALRNIPVRSITSIYEDDDGYFGDGPSAFAAGSLLTAGSDYYLSREKAGISWTGHVYRIATGWCSVPGSIKVTYVAGLTDAELDGDYSPVRWAVLRTFGDLWARAKSLQGGQRMDGMTSESIGGGVSASYVNEQLRGAPIPDDAAAKIEHLVSYADWSV